MSKSIVRSLCRAALSAVMCVFAVSLAMGQVRDQSGGGGIPSPPEPGETVRDVPDGWIVVGTGSADARKLYLECLAAFNRYIAAEQEYGAESGQATVTMQEYRGALDTYYRDGCGMVRDTWEPPPPQGGTDQGGGGDPGDSGPGPETVLHTVLITEGVRIQEKEYRLYESDVSRTVYGHPSDRGTVWVTVHGRVTDSMGSPVHRATVRLTSSGKSDRTNEFGDYSISFQHDGFESVEIMLNPVLAPRCLVVTPRVASFGTVALGANPSDFVFVENTCPDETIDVSYDLRIGPYHLETVDCTGGQDGVIWSATGDRRNSMIMGPSSRCKLRLSFVPASDGSWDEKLHFNGSDVPGAPVKLRAMATATDVVLVGAKAGHLSGTTGVGSSKDWTVTIKNGSSTSPLEIVVSDFDGVASGDFDAEIVAVTGVAPPPPPPPGQPPAPLVPHPRVITLPPGAQAMVAVTFEPRATGLREATLVFETSNPSVAVVKIPVSGIGD